MQHLKTLESGIETLRTSSSTKTRFAFKRTARPPAEVPVSVLPPAVVLSAPTSASSSSSQLSISNRHDVHLTTESLDTTPEPLPSHSSLSVSSLSSCVLDLRSTSSSPKGGITVNALHVKNLRRVVLLAGYIDGSVMLHDCEDCLIVLGCRQVSMAFSEVTSASLSK